ncbi:MAG: hypothetical protein K0S23_2699 [Fluviicola sp.]|jgi:hypothetical protein|nr:hypothetical protein [Fluviicola sp.]
MYLAKGIKRILLPNRWILFRLIFTMETIFAEDTGMFILKEILFIYVKMCPKEAVILFH